MSLVLRKKQKFKTLKDAYVIFICQHDKFGKNEPIYHVDKIVRETKEEFEDGSHIIYVNGNYNGDDDFGKLSHDFNCKESKDIYFEPLAEGVRHFKETEEGREAMCESFTRLADKVADERAEQTKVETKVDMIKSLMSNMKWTLDQALTASGIDGKERAIIAKQLQK